MSVSGCGSSSVGAALSDLTGIAYRDGDDRQSAEYLAKIWAGTPLAGDDRSAWLELCGADERIVPQGIDPRLLVSQAPLPRHPALANVVLQPHHGSATTETRKAMGGFVRSNLAAHFAGKPLLTTVL